MLEAEQCWNMRGEIWRDNILGLCKEFGWTASYVLDMPLKAYFQSLSFLRKLRKEEERQMRQSQSKKGQTFGGRLQ